MLYMLSYPRSGNHWLRYIVEYLSGRPTMGITRHEKAICQQSRFLMNNLKAEIKRFQSSVPLTKPIAIKSHGNGIEGKNRKNNQLFFLIRDPKECITKQCFPEHAGNRSITRKMFDNYMKLIACYDQWVGPKELFYYELLIECPEEITRRIASFLKSSKDQSFIDNLEKFKNDSLNIRADKYTTKGKKKKHYAEKLINAEEVDAWIDSHELRKYVTKYL